MVIQIKPCEYEAWNSKGNTLDLERLKKGLQVLNRRLRLNPTIIKLGRGLWLSKLEYEEEIFSYEQVVKMLFMAWFKRGNALGNLEQYKNAVISYKRTIEIPTITKPGTTKVFF